MSTSSNDDTTRRVTAPSPLSRQEFLRTAGSAALFAALGITVTACGGTSTDPGIDEDGDGTNGGGSGNGITINGSTVVIDLTSDAGKPLGSSGGWLLSTAAGILAVNVDGSTIRAFSNVCTHSGCPDSWQFTSGQFVCTCHNSKFNTAGEVVEGPANRNLPEYAVSRNGNTVTITK